MPRVVREEAEVSGAFMSVPLSRINVPPISFSPACPLYLLSRVGLGRLCVFTGSLDRGGTQLCVPVMFCFSQ